MATFNNMLVTNDGKLIYAKAMSGKAVTFSKVAFGSGNPASQEVAETLSNLVKQEIVGAIESINTTTTEGVAIITTQVSNASLTEPIGIKEVGVFCLDPDTGTEVMYAYMFSSTDIDVIPSNENGEVIWKMRVQLAISNATGSTTQQSELVPFTPIVTATATDGTTTFLSQVVARGKSLVKGNLVTVFYEITGNLTNMGIADSGLSALTISLPRTAAENCLVSFPMTVTLADNSEVIVEILGEIEKDGEVIDINYFGVQSGDFVLKATIQYVI